MGCLRAGWLSPCGAWATACGTRFLPNTRRWNKLAHHWRLGLAGPRNGTRRSPKGLFSNTGKQNTSTTGKWIGLAVVLIVLGIGLDRLAFSERIKMILSVSALLGSFLFPLGVLLQTLDRGNGPRALTVLGSVLVIGAFGTFALGIARKSACAPQ